MTERASKPKPTAAITIVWSTSPADLRSDQIERAAWTRHPENQFGLPGAEGAEAIVRKMTAASMPLGAFGTAYFGIQTHDRESFVANRPVSRRHKPVVDGVHISRYSLAKGSEFVDFRPAAIKSGGKQSVHESARIGVRQIGEVPVATIIPNGVYTLNTIYNVFFTRDAGYSLEFILGILQSRTVRFFWQQSFFDQKRTFPKIKKDALLSVPVPLGARSDRPGAARAERLTALVQQMLKLAPRVNRATTDVERVPLQRQVTAIDRQIDQLVYELYGLTDEEIRIVEEATGGTAAKD